METNEYYIILRDKLNEIREKTTNIEEVTNNLKETMKESILIDNEVLNNDLFELINNNITEIINNIDYNIIPIINKKI